MAWSKAKDEYEHLDYDFDEEDEFEYKLSLNEPAPFSITGDKAVRSITSFTDTKLGLDAQLVKNIVDKWKYEKPTPVQCHAMPQMMAKRDLMCCSYTQSGKTMSYLLPLINMILQEKNCVKTSLKQPFVPVNGGRDYSPMALILVPTRELAEQVAKDANLFAEDLSKNVETLAIFGGDSIPKEIRAIRQGRASIIAATPGRLLHLLSETDFKGLMNLKKVKFLVIDEADEMFNRGFFPEIGKIIEGYMVPKEQRTNFMFSATFERQIQTYAKKHLREDYVYVVVGCLGGAAPNLQQDIRCIGQVEKRSTLLKIIDGEVNLKDTKILVFCNKIDTVCILEQFLRNKEYKVAAIHSELEQYYRDQALKDFNDGRKNILVATSVASRGLNIKGSVCVVNFDFPKEISDYVQRIGRARATGTGLFPKAISFFDNECEDEIDILPELVLTLRKAKHPVPKTLKDLVKAKEREKKEMESVNMNDDLRNRLKRFRCGGKRIQYFENFDMSWA